ncbi:sushi, von Willebrand factor type A, EGF and pentraxin domain-containing protein 1-like [Dreissena polymorpha]|uniref:sushi, von Willebrand factor type A, EGF and pentraxin domain-containing protein 1-like n=1 Tax=Dreissena polymorpha TaxID=45954 RepID=UPI0022656666|nr:sushi, von Willebrand factor type A, EGF and pentraxin domain-containing protein 1-like [Dreissena polymorpha]
MDGWAFQPQGSSGGSVSAWECLSNATFATDGTLIMLTRNSFNLLSNNYYAYLCITLTQVTTASYQFYIRHEPHPNVGSERVYLSIVNSVTEPSRICNTTHGASGPEYNMLIRVGGESAAKVTCPYTFLGRYGYTHFSSTGSFTCDAATSELDACTNTQHMKFNYTACSTRVTYSQTCETLSNPPRGIVAIATSGSVTTATYTCQANYTLWGNVSRICQADNKWGGSEPFCNCAIPPTPSNGIVVVNSGGTVATFSCNVGYTLSGVRTRMCQDGLTWDGSNPTCVKCQTLASVSGQTSTLSTNATVTSVTFSCANGYTLNGIASMTCLSTGNWTDVQPSCTICKTLTNPLSGTVTLSTNGLVTKATYSCSSGYTLQGVTNRTCLTDGNWDGADSTCSCDAPSTPIGGSVAANGSVALYTCNLGSTIIGSASRSCQSDGSGWSGTNPACTTCVTLTTVVGGSYSLTTNGIQTSATYTCNVGFTLNGDNQITCQSTGVWSPVQPTCVKCATLDNPSSGRVTLLTSGTKTSATYSCSSGYSLNGVTIRLCNPDGSWSLSAPTCTCIGPPSVVNGNVTSDGSKATYMCHIGYSISGVSTRTCSSTGSGWSDTDPTCTTCATLPSPTGGSVLMTSDGLNTKATYSCLTGYTLNGISPITCRSDGTWNFQPPTCAKCPDLVDPSSGTVIVNSSGGVTTASFSCATGYYISGASQLTCKTDGNWDKSAPTCKCNFPLAIANGGVSVSDSAGATAAAYRCDRGYSLSGLNSRLCMSDGSGWQGADPSCTVCQTLPVAGTGTITYTTNGTHTIASFRCDSGSTLKGTSELTCQSNGQWNSSPPTCVSCPTPGTITSGSVSMTTTGTVTTATYTCLSGYELTSLGTLTCQVTGNWDRPSPTCVCLIPPLISNGYFDVSLDKTTVTYTCNVNFILVGGSTRTCKFDGTGWSGIAPSCEKCNTLAYPTGGTISYSTDGLTPTANYSCVVGYTLDGDSVRTCLTNKSWVPQAPVCVYCSNVPTLPSGVVSLRTDGRISVGTFTCLGGYTLKGSATSTCLITGMWSGTTPVCECNSPGVPSNGGMVADGRTANYTCNAGYSIQGSSIRACAADGTGWSGSDPLCVLCTTPTMPLGGTYVLGTSGTQTHATISCESGYSVSGSNKIFCGSDGSWNAVPVCASCPPLDPPGSGSVVLTSNSLVTIATYSCSPGYALDGARQRTCNHSGIWDLQPPKCFCNSPSIPQNGAMMDNGYTANYTCTVGFSLDGDHIRLCANDGSGWSGQNPQCTPCKTLTFSTLSTSVALTTDGLETTASFSCAVGYTLNGHVRITCRSDGTWDFSQPLCAQCPTLTSSSSGTVSIVTNNTTTVASFTCLPGYILSGSRSITCQPTGQWSDATPMCKCLAPSTPSQGTMVVSDLNNTQTARYSCNLGFVISGPSNRKCQAQGFGWEGLDPTCEKCASLTNPIGGSISYTTDGLTTTANYSCVVGYTLTGSAFRTCHQNGTFTPTAPTCVYCSTVSSPASGNVTLHTDGVTSTAVYACAVGYSLVGMATRTCLSSGIWNGTTPSCECDPPATPSNGTMVANGKTSNYTCNIGFALQGEAYRKCLTSGLGWSDTDPVCNKCASLTSPVGGSFTFGSTGSQTFAMFTCNTGYTIHGVSKIYCSSSGIWEVSPVCTACPTLNPPSSGSLSLVSTGYVTFANYACASGYFLSGTTQRTCLPDGTWDLTAPTCACNSLLPPQHGTVTDNGTIATYSCKVGYSLGGAHIRTCALDGTGWSGTSPACSTCKTLSTTSGGSVTLSTNGLETRASFSCDLGYTLSGDVAITCRGDGTWDFSQPQCVQCTTSPTIASGYVTMTTDGLVTTATFDCNSTISSYYLSGSRSITCTTSGKWRSAFPTCKCNSPSTPTKGGMFITDDAAGQVAHYSCILGYSISGMTSRRCMSDGTGWQDVNPTCNLCDDITTPPELTVTLTSNGSVTSAHYACSNNYTLLGEHVHTCSSSGMWNYQMPTCVLCANKTDPLGGRVKLTTDGLLTTATFTCLTGYDVNSTAVIKCDVTGNWNLPDPFCVCNPPRILANGAMELLDDGMTANYSCDIGFELVGSDVRYCATDGTGWDGTEPRCDMIETTTPTPVPADDGSLTFPREAFIAIVVVVILVIIALVAIAFVCYMRYRKEHYKIGSQPETVSEKNKFAPERPSSAVKSYPVNEVNDKSLKTTFDPRTLRNKSSSMKSLYSEKAPSLNVEDKIAPETATVHIPDYFPNGDHKLPLSSIRLPKLPPRPPEETKETKRVVKAKRRKRRRLENPLPSTMDAIGASNGSLPNGSLPNGGPRTSTPIEVRMRSVDTPTILSSEHLDYIQPVYCVEPDGVFSTDSKTFSVLRKVMDNISKTESSV